MEIKKIFFSGKNFDCFQVVVQGEDYEKCDRSSGNLYCNEKTGHYGSGMLNSKDDERRTERVGLLGEMAFSKVFNVDVDFEYCKYGKDADFIIGPNKKVDVKTSTSSRDCGLIQVINENGVKLPLKSDIYVFAILEKDERRCRIAIVNLIGYSLKNFIEKITPVLGRKGSTHKNIEVPYKDLKPMKLLLKAHEKYLCKDLFS